MVNANAKTPNRKRKSLPAGDDSQSPKLLKAEGGAKSPNAGAAKTPNKGANTPFKGKNTPGKERTAEVTPAKSPKENKKQTNTPANKVKKFKGTANLVDAETQVKTEKPAAGKVKVEKAEGKKNKKLSVEKRKAQFTNLKQKVNSGDAAVLAELEEKIKIIEGRKELTKTAKRKLKMLQKLRSTMTGEKIEPKKNKKTQKAKKGGAAVAKVVDKKKKVKEVVAQKEEVSDKDEDSSDKPDAEIKLIKGEVDDEEDSEDEDSDDEEDDDEDDEEETPGKGRRINVLYTQGGKKQSEGKKNVVKAKNLKLHAMRKQGQLAGSVKENQKRSFRRGQKNAKAPVNGDS